MLKPILNKFAPRWIIFLLDFIFSSCTFLFSFFIVRHLIFDIPHFADLLPALFINALLFVVCVMVFPIYKGIIRYSELNDINRIVKFAFLHFALWLILFFVKPFPQIAATVSLGLLFINLFASIFTLVIFRILVKEIYFRAISKSSIKKRAVIYGAGAMGQVTRKVLLGDIKNYTDVVAYIDDSPSKVGKNLDGLPILPASGEKLELFLKEKEITHLFIAIDNISVDKKIAITDISAPYKITINVIPQANQWRDGLFQKNQVKKLNIEDLLEREEINLPKDVLRDAYENSVILVTGAAGSIGSEICRQIAKVKFKKLILVDQSESGLFDLEYELRQKGNKATSIQVEIASVRDKARMKKIFFTFKPEIVFHAAAYKHVPLMETFPCEAILTNISGTRLIGELSLFFNVKKFVLISTDKAVNPTNIMGATKRISEIFIQALSDHKGAETQFIVTRFGNVLGSAGSVIPTFRKQIEQGGPLTITHPEITRYFMTIPEASKLVLEAGIIGQSGDILLFDMGKPVKIIDLARRMIHLAGLRPGADIRIVQTKLRPGEKMYEELFKDSEQFIETDHPRILKAKRGMHQEPDFMQLLDELDEIAHSHKNDAALETLQRLLPEFTPYTYLEQPILVEEKKIS